MDKLILSLGVIAIIMSIAFGALLDLSPKHIETTKCYDRFSNEIIGVTCEEIRYDSYFLQELSGFAFIIIIMFIMGILMIIVGIID